MGTSHSWAELEHKLTRLATDYADLPAVVVPEGAQIVKKSVEVFMPRRLRGVGKNGAKLTVTVNSTKAPGDAKALVFVKGPAQLIEGPTKAHQIPKQRETASFVGVFGHAVIPGGAEGGIHGRGGVRTRVMHPGTKGKRPWAKGVAAAEPLVARMFATQGSIPLRRIF